MANSNGWGDGAANNAIGWGQGANNAIAWGDSHAKSWAGATDIVGFDASSISYFNATGITGATQQDAIDNLIRGLKEDGIWSKMKAVYPFVTDNRNLFGYTEDFSNAAWTKEAATITSNSVIAPNGTTTADTFTATATNASHYLSQNVNVTTGNTITFSCYVKNNGGNFVQLVAGGTDFTPVDPYQNFNLQTGTLASGNITNSTITNVGNGWFRIASSVTSTSTAVGYFFIAPILNGTTGRLSAFTGDGTSGIYIWGAQLEVGSPASTYQAITTTQQAYISNQFKYNLVNPVDSDAAFRLVFNGGWTFSSNGATPNGTNGYADTKLVPSSVFLDNSQSYALYTPISNTSVNVLAGVSNGLSTIQFYNPIGQYNVNNNAYVKNSSMSNGFILKTGFTNNSTSAYEKGVKLGNSFGTVLASPSFNYYIGSRNNANTPDLYSNRQYSFTMISTGLTDTEAANLYTRVQAYQTALSRNV